MTTFTKRRARPIRPKARQRRSYGTFFGFLAAAVLFAGLGLLASNSVHTPPHVPVRGKTITIDGRPSAIAVSSGAAFVADDATQTLHVIDPSKGRVVGSPIAVSKNPIALAIDRDSVYVGHASGEISRVSIAHRRVTGVVRAGGSITGLTVFRSKLWAADLGRREVLEIDPVHLRVVRRVHDVGPVRIIADSGALWMTTDRDEVARYVPSTGDLRRVKVGVGPIGLAAGGGSIWTANNDRATVSRVDEKTMRVVGQPIAVGKGPTNVVFRAGRIWVTNNDDRTVSRIDVSSGAIVPGEIRTVPDVRGVVSDRDLWYVGTDPDEVVRLSE
jgi:DNA-binding beta-propeller fold protein YncE